MELVGILLWVLVAAPDTDAIADARKAVYERGGYQSTIPGRGAMPTDGSGSRSSSRRRRTDPPARTPEVAGDIGRSLLWVFAFVLGALALLWLATTWRERRRVALANAAAPAPVNAPEPVPHTAIADAERFAQQGNYREAIHATLLQLLLGFADRLPAAWTSREAARIVQRDEFTRLVELVERTLFGGLPATREDYEQAKTWSAACRPGAAT